MMIVKYGVVILSKELVKGIEGLGDRLGDIITIAEEVRNMIYKIENKEYRNYSISNVILHLKYAEDYYNGLHSYYLGRLARKH